MPFWLAAAYNTVPGVELFLIEFLRKIPVVIIPTDLLYL